MASRACSCDAHSAVRALVLHSLSHYVVTVMLLPTALALPTRSFLSVVCQFCLH